MTLQRRVGLQSRSSRLQPGGRLAKVSPRRLEANGGRLPELRRSELRPRSAKTAKRYVTRRQIVREMFLYPEVCEVPWCTEIATDPHEALTRARGGDILDRSIIRKVCHPHNVEFASDEQPWMYELGFLIHSWDRPS